MFALSRIQWRAECADYQEAFALSMTICANHLFAMVEAKDESNCIGLPSAKERHGFESRSAPRCVSYSGLVCFHPALGTYSSCNILLRADKQGYLFVLIPVNNLSGVQKDHGDTFVSLWSFLHKEEVMNAYKGIGPLSNETTQGEKVLGSNQVPNSDGAYVWPVDDWVRLERFLILGSEGGSYYASERTLTKENAEACMRCIEADGRRVVRTVSEVSISGRAPKNDPALFVLAMCASARDEDVRKEALEALPRVARIGTHLFHFVEYVEQFRRWGRGLRSGVANWYTSKDVRDLAYQVVKYQQRDGWSHRDLLRKSHPSVRDNPELARVFAWVTGKSPEIDQGGDLDIIWAFEQAKKSETDTQVADLIIRHGLPREAIPSNFLNSPAVWSALLKTMPMEAMVRNLATMTSIGLLERNNAETALICERLRDKSLIRRSRLHPVKILSALTTYSAGHGRRSSKTWEPISKITDALDDAFYLAFDNVTPSGKHILLALDVSSSMTLGEISGTGLTPRAASAAMTMVTAATEPNVDIVAFSGGLTPLDVSPRQESLSKFIGRINKLPFDITDCAIPMDWAQKNNKKYDAFVIYTDSETNVLNSLQPATALRKYRVQSGVSDAKLIVVGMVANSVSIADPNDAGMMDVVGFDTSTPDLISQFIG